jgi:predicted RND superfamily exporter protein
MAQLIVSKRKMILILFSISTVLSIFLIPAVKVNYSMSDYLPQDMPVKKAMEVLDREFGLTGSAQVMVEGVSVVQAKEIKDQMTQVAGVKSVTWLDDLVDIRKPLEIYDTEMVDDFYIDGAALYQIVFVEDDYSLKVGSALDEIREITGKEIAIRGPAAAAKAVRETTSKEIFTIVAFVLPVFLVILLLSTSSWFESLLFITVIGISVIINMGTNVIFGEVSFMTQMSAAVLQFAIAMDYSIFLLHRFAEERAEGAAVLDAMRRALYKSFSSITASALTTVAGFVALMFMRYRIGMDMGLVLAKGIVFSLVSVILLLPALAILSDKLIERTHHKSFLPNFNRFGKLIVKSRYIIIAILFILLFPAYRGQEENHFLYGESSIALSDGSEMANEEDEILNKFGPYNPVVLLVPAGNIAKEAALAEKLTVLDSVNSVQALVTLADTAIAREMLPQSVIDQFETEHYSRMIITLNTEVEGKATFAAVEQLNELIKSYYGEDFMLVGSSPSVLDIKTVVEVDFNRVTLISILAVSLILLFTFRSLVLPVILILVIETSIWINMAVPYFMDQTLNFIGYMIVSSIQLGGTIDYAILFTNRYMDNRKTMDKKEAAAKAVSDSGGSILTSAAILASAGLILGEISSIKGISELGTLIGRGAIISGLLVFVFLPQLLVLCDGLIKRTTIMKKDTIKSNSNPNDPTKYHS